jgi:hypothetical protein
MDFFVVSEIKTTLHIYAKFTLRLDL